MRNLVTAIWQFYVEGFRSMTLGRTLWLIIAIKLFIMFFILRLFFFPNYLNEAAAGADKEDYVSRELIQGGTAISEECSVRSEAGQQFSLPQLISHTLYLTINI